MSDTPHGSGAVFDVLCAPYPYPTQDIEPVAHQRRAQQKPEGTPSELREREDNNSDPKQSQHETQPECTKEEDERECRDDE